MYESEKGFLEELADKIPGIKGYRDKEARRDTDKRLREYVASIIDGQHKSLDGVKRAMLGKGKLDQLDDVDRVGGKLQRSADAIRFATYGYSGLFDQVKMQDEELERLYRYDRELLGHVRELDEQVSGAESAADPAAALAALEKAADNLIDKIEARKQLFNKVP